MICVVGLEFEELPFPNYSGPVVSFFRAPSHEGDHVDNPQSRRRVLKNSTRQASRWLDMNLVTRYLCFWDKILRSCLCSWAKWCPCSQLLWMWSDATLTLWINFWASIFESIFVKNRCLGLSVLRTLFIHCFVSDQVRFSLISIQARHRLGGSTVWALCCNCCAATSTFYVDERHHQQNVNSKTYIDLTSKIIFWHPKRRFHEAVAWAPIPEYINIPLHGA